MATGLRAQNQEGKGDHEMGSRRASRLAAAAAGGTAVRLASIDVNMGMHANVLLSL